MKGLALFALFCFQFICLGQEHLDLVVFDDANHRLVGLKTRGGDTVWSAQFDDITGMNQDHNFRWKYWAVLQNDQYGVIDQDGKMILPIAYNSIVSTSKGEAFIVHQNDRLGIVNSAGKLIIPFNYEHIEEIDVDYYSVRKKDVVGIMNSKGALVLPVIYDSIGRNYQDGIFSVFDKTDLSWRMVDDSGKVYIENCQQIYRGIWSLVDTTDNLKQSSTNTLFAIKDESLYLLYHGEFRIVDSTIQYFDEPLKLFPAEEDYLLNKQGKIILKSTSIFHPSPLYYYTMENSRLTLIDRTGAKKIEFDKVRAWISEERNITIWFKDDRTGSFDVPKWKWVDLE